MIKRRYYWLLVSLAAMGPYLICRSQSDERWQRWSEWVYARIVSDDHVSGESSLAIIDIDQKTLDTFGWPIPREHYRDLLSALDQSGHPVVLSFLRFQELGKIDRSAIPEDQILATSIKKYGSLIGTGLNIDTELSTELDLTDHQLVVTKAVAGVKKPDDINLPKLPIVFDEGRAFMNAERSFGFGARLGGERIVLCPQTALTAKPDLGDFAILSSVALAAGEILNQGISMSSGATYFNSKKQRLKLSYRTCIRHYKVTTADYLAKRHIPVFSFADVVTRRIQIPHHVKGIVLGHKDLRRVQGPGGTGNDDDAVTLEHHLMSRLLDGILMQDIVHRDISSSKSNETQMVLLLSFILLVLAVVFEPIVAASVAGAIAFIVLNKAYYMISIASKYQIYTQVLAAAVISAVLFAVAAQILQIAGIRWRLRFANLLNRELSKSNSLEDLDSGVTTAGVACFQKLNCTLSHPYGELYRAAFDPKYAATWLARGGDKNISDNAPLTSSDKILKPAGKTKSWRTPRFTHFRVKSTFSISAESYKLGNITVEANISHFERKHFSGMMEVLSSTLNQHWRRVDLMVRSRVGDYKLVTAHSKTDILTKFLPKSLVRRFDDTLAMETNLQKMLTPQSVKAALMQADIRGFSKLAGKYDNLELVTLIQTYFKRVVDVAQQYAQVKLIGDCIFLFVEDQVMKGEMSAVDFVAEIAALLVQETNRRNAERVDGKEIPLHFGIAVHYGEVVVGNLSSDDCIDYTVIGADVNLTARLEELTKTPSVRDAIGENGIIFTPSSIAGLKKHSRLKFGSLDLDTMNAKVRSFEHVSQISFMTGSAATIWLEQLQKGKNIAA